MTIVRCPRCRDEVSVPAKATSRALVRCPLCLEEYLLAEALANAPPPLIVIGGEVGQAAIDSPAEDSEDYQLAASGLSAAALHAATFHSAAPTAGTSLAPRPAVRTLPRHRRQEKSGGGLLLAVNYVVGGVMGLALGLLVLWWGFRKDPLELGPPIARYVPAIVPAEFRGKPASDDSASSGSRPAAPADDAVVANEGGNNRRRKKQVAVEPKEPAAELQTLPGFDEPAKLPGAALTPSIDAPTLKDRGAAAELPANDLLQQLPQPAAAISDLPATVVEPSPRPPMPDLTDLLP